jgi:DNA cross-link repair 1A protein
MLISESISGSIVSNETDTYVSCPGAALFLFEIPDATAPDGWRRHLHTGDFRALPYHARHPALVRAGSLDTLFLDTTYLNPTYAFPSQTSVLKAVTHLVSRIHQHGGVSAMLRKNSPLAAWLKTAKSSTATRSASNSTAQTAQSSKSSERILYIVGCYLIGKERIFQTIAEAIDAKIYVTEDKRKILNCFADQRLSARLTADPHAADVHVVNMHQLKKEVSHAALPIYGTIYSLLPQHTLMYIVSPV